MDGPFENTRSDGDSQRFDCIRSSASELQAADYRWRRRRERDDCIRGYSFPDGDRSSVGATPSYHTSQVRAGVPLAAWSILLLSLSAVGARGQKLEIQSPAMHQFDGGPAMPQPPEYRGGETFFFTCLFSGYKANPKDAISLEYTIEPVDQEGVPLAKSESKKIEAELAPEEKDWKPKVHYQFETPNTAS